MTKMSAPPRLVWLKPLKNEKPDDLETWHGVSMTPALHSLKNHLDIKLWTPGECLSLPRGYIHVRYLIRFRFLCCLMSVSGNKFGFIYLVARLLLNC